VKSGSETPSRGLAIVLEAIDLTLKRLALVAQCPEARALLEATLACAREAEGWRALPASVEQREALMKRVLALHVAASRLKAP
jgi:hypothetical protein